MKNCTCCSVYSYVSKSVFLGILLLCLHITGYSQTYYSDFTTPNASHYTTISPSGGTLCLSIPAVSSSSSVADADLNNYAQIYSLLSLGINCNQSNYIVSAKLNFGTSGLTAAPAGYYAGFRLRLNTLLNVNLLSSGIVLNTYRSGVFQEAANGAGLIGLNLLSGSTSPQNIYFKTNMDFDQVEIVLNSSVVAVGAGIDYRFFYAFGASPTILPVKLTSFSATQEGKSIRLNWTTATEANTARYEIERSSDGGRTFSGVGTVNAKGTTTSETKYSFSDGSVLSGDYQYRLRIVDKDGSYEISKVVSIKSSIAASWRIYPSLLHSGENMNVVLSGNAGVKSDVKITNLQGQTVRSLTTTDSKLTIATSGLTPGLYAIKLYRGGALIATEKVVVQ